MKGTLISLVLTSLLVTSLFQPHQHILAASENNTDEVTNGCIGLQCRFAISDEADLFMDQLTVGPSRMLLSSPANTITFPTVQSRNVANLLAFATALYRNCGVIFNHVQGSIVTPLETA
ncbi:RALF [Trifolium medium]|uniref:RALF n=1 Tax=Trifolium medium TaxID=97028 RepID=A0A392LY04_9FABA|nr:RALF [Trifolium medium]